MAETKVAKRYAKSLLDLGIEMQIADSLFNDMSLVVETSRTNKALSLLFKSPIVNTDKKDLIIREIFGTRVHRVSLEFMQIITRKHREYYLEDIAKSYVSLYKIYKHIQPAFIIAAAPINEDIRRELLAIINKDTSDKIELQEKIDTSLIGGFILRWGDRQIDASVSNKLHELKREFKQNLYLKDY